MPLTIFTMTVIELSLVSLESSTKWQGQFKKTSICFSCVKVQLRATTSLPRCLTCQLPSNNRRCNVTNTVIPPYFFLENTMDELARNLSRSIYFWEKLSKAYSQWCLHCKEGSQDQTMPCVKFSGLCLSKISIHNKKKPTFTSSTKRQCLCGQLQSYNKCDKKLK